MTRPIPPVDIKQYASQDEIKFKLHPKEQPTELLMEVHKCTTSMDQRETTNLVRALIQNGYAIWGEAFMAHMNYLMRQEV